MKHVSRFILDLLLICLLCIAAVPMAAAEAAKAPTHKKYVRINT